MPKDLKAWQARLASALDVGAVLLVAHEFISEWTAEELHRLPHGCFPPPMTHADEVSGYALTLLQLQYKCLAEGEEMETMTAFFATAAGRLSEICAELEAARRRIIRTSPHFNLGNKSAV
jgi:hypothetical protein